MRKTNILIVDDRQENIHALSGLIASDDVEIFTALSAEEALRHLTENEFGLALLDVQMPETSGFELARLLRGVRRFHHLPIIFVTAHQHSQSIVFEGYDSGAVDILFKPLDPHIVRTKVRVFVELNQQRNTLQENIAELQRLRIEAEAATVAKSQFLANMSHEIRTPLAAVMGFADLISRPDFTDAEKVQFLASVKRNGDLLLSLIDDILDLSKLEANRMELDNSTFNFNDLLKDVKSTLSFKAETRDVKLNVATLEDGDLIVTSDILRVKQVLLNVIGNAIKFSSKGKVDVWVDRLPPNKIRILVEDTGVGMTPEQTQRLFQPFGQADASTRRQFGGTGLGLIISRQILSALGGSLRLVKTAPNAGSTFEIIFSFEKVAQPAQTPEAAAPSETTPVDATPQNLSGRRVLVVDDAPDNLTLIEMYLRSTGIDLTTVDSGQSAIERVKNEDFDLVLMDVQMPGLDGHETTREIRRLGFSKPVIALTAHAVKTERDRCRESGCNETLTKPIARKELLREVARFLEA